MILSLVSIVRPVAESCASAGQTGFLVLFPHGGQASSRRNAYRSVLLDESAAAHRRRITTALDRATIAPHIVDLRTGHLTHA